MLNKLKLIGVSILKTKQISLRLSTADGKVQVWAITTVHYVVKLIQVATDSIFVPIAVLI
jgi:hypothetical protein